MIKRTSEESARKGGNPHEQKAQEKTKEVDTYDIAVLLAPDGTELVSLKESNAELRRLSGIVLTISAALFGLLCAALLGALFTGANPERHPYLVTIFFARKPIFY